MQIRPLFLCPVATRAESVDIKGSRGSTFVAWRAPYYAGEAEWPIEKGSYAPNHAVFGVGVPPTPEERRYSVGRWTTLPPAPRAANVPVFLDSSAMIPFFISEWTDPPPYEDYGFPECCIDRHSCGINCLFADWSVRKAGLKELWMLDWYPGYDTHGPWTKAGGVKPEDWPLWMRKFRDY